MTGNKSMIMLYVPLVVKVRGQFRLMLMGLARKSAVTPASVLPDSRG
jgi:hypothetical protein